MKKKQIIKTIAFLLVYNFFNIFNTQSMKASTEQKIEKKYFCTSADSNFFSLLLNLIGSIHRVHFNDLQEIAVFDLGLSSEQRKVLSRIEKISVYPIEMTHPDLLTYVHMGNPDGRPGQGKMVRGWYAWKPVAMKQALDMFPYFLYLDAGTLVLKPLDDLFEHIKQQGYFFVDCGGWSIRSMTTEYVINKFNLLSPEKRHILDAKCMSAGFQGLTSKVYNEYVVPMYELSRDLRNFIDDGTTPKGFGTGRHDQSLFSIYAALLGLDVMTMDYTQKNPIWLRVNNEQRPLYINWHTAYVDDKTHILLQASQTRDFRSLIRYKNI